MSKTIFVCVCLIGLTQMAWSQSDSVGAVPGHARGIPGYLNPQTGAFTAKVQPNSQISDNVETPTTLSEVVGTWKTTLTISISSSIPSGDTILCAASISTYDETGGGSYNEEASAVASRSGNTATCTVSIPYAWFLASKTMDFVSSDYSVTAFAAGAQAQQGLYRSNSHSVPAVALPANGVITTVTYTVRI